MITVLIGSLALAYSCESEIGFFLKLITIVLSIICDVLIKILKTNEVEE